MRAAGHSSFLCLRQTSCSERGEAPVGGKDDGTAGLLAHHAPGSGQPETGSEAPGGGLPGRQEAGAPSDAGHGNLGQNRTCQNGTFRRQSSHICFGIRWFPFQIRCGPLTSPISS